MFKKRLRVVVTTEDFRNAKCYTDATNCPLVVAIKRQIGGVTYASCSVGHVEIKHTFGRAHYSVTKKWCSYQELYGGKLKGLEIDDMIGMAKADKNVVFPDKVLILKLV